VGVTVAVTVLAPTDTDEVVAAWPTVRVWGVALDPAYRLSSVGVKTAPIWWEPTVRPGPTRLGLVAVPSESSGTALPYGAPSRVNCTDPS
jgi:hypothetical protein